MSSEPTPTGQARRLVREALDSPREHAEDAVAQMVSGLIESRRFLSNILESSTEYSIIAKDLERRVLSWNAGARRNYGYAPSEVLGKSSDMLHSAEDLESGLVDRLHREALENGRASGTFRRLRKDGSIFTASVVITRRDEDGEPVGYLIISRDVTEEEALRRVADERRLLLDNILESSTEYSIIAQDTERRIMTWNAGARRNYGYTAEEMVGQTSDILHDRAELRSGIVDQMYQEARRNGHAEGILRRQRKDGSGFTASVVITPRHDADGEFVGYLVISRDVTIEQELRRAVEEDRRRLAEADRRKDEFLATLAHELRNPLAPLATAARILEREGAGEAHDEAARVVGRQVANMTRIVDDLLDIARISQGKITLRREQTDLQDIVDSALDVVRDTIAQKRHHLRLDVPKERLMLQADRTRLSQALGNLLQNAAKYTPANGRVTLTVRREGDEAVIAVEDDGYGLPKALQEEIFGLFVQAHTHEGHGGLGLGLSLVKKVVQLHGGSVSAFSEGPGKGSVFTMRLPLDATQKAIEGKLRVLVVDDNRDAAQSVAALMKLEGLEARVAFGGSECLEMVDEFTPHVIVCDLGMPGIDGFEVARRLREAGSNVKLIALSGFARDADRARSKEAGFDAHYGKPPDMDGLLAEVRSAA